MTINLLDSDICVLREIFIAKKIPDLEAGYEEVELELT